MASTTIGAASPPPMITLYGPRSSWEGSPGRPRRTNAITSSATTTAKTTMAPANIAHHSVLMSRAGRVAGLVIAWLELQPVARRTGSPRGTKRRLPAGRTPRVTSHCDTRSGSGLCTRSGVNPHGPAERGRGWGLTPDSGHATASDSSGAGLEDRAVELVGHPQRRETVRRGVDGPAEGREGVPARAAAAGRADQAVLAVLVLPHPLAPAREGVPAARPQPVEAGARDPVRARPGGARREARPEGVALLHDRAVRVAASPPRQQRRVLPQHRHPGAVDSVVGVGEEVLPVAGRELEPGGRRRVVAVDVVELDRVEALVRAHGDTPVDHRLQPVELADVDPALLRETEVDVSERPPGEAARAGRGIGPVGLPGQVDVAVG